LTFRSPSRLAELAPIFVVSSRQPSFGVAGFDLHLKNSGATFLNAFSRSYGEKALELCRQVFLEKDAGTPTVTSG
jgi:hypothetical protein